MADFSDPTDALAGSNFRQNEPNGLTLFFKQVATGLTAEFKAFLTDFNDSFTSQWNGQEVWGRMDEIQTFKNTKRVISVSWTIPSHSEEEAISNFKEVAKMTSMLYPVYEDIKTTNSNQNQNLGSALGTIEGTLIGLNLDPNSDEFKITENSLKQIEDTILSSNDDFGVFPKIKENISLLSSPPIVQMKFKNWISNNDDSGLYGTLAGFNTKPVIASGVFLNNGKLIPMEFECSVEFTVIHTDKLGHDQNKQPRTFGFPYDPIPVKK